MKIAKKLLRCLFSLIFSLIILYADILFSFPAELTMYKNETHNSFLGAGVTLSPLPQSICISSTAKNVTPINTGEYAAYLKVANLIPVRKIKVTVTEQQSICASGELVGLRIHNRGLIVTDTAPVKSRNSEISPARNAGILPGDIILEINGHKVHSGDDVASYLKENTLLILQRNSAVIKIKLTPARDDSDGKLKIGVWVRDSTAGVGTMTYFNPQTLSFGALGHGISDSDTGILFNVQSGTVEKSRVVSVKKGHRGTPGEICGSFSYEKSVCGTVEKNCEAGVFGSIFPDFSLIGKNYPIGVMSQVEPGDAVILSTVDDGIKEYKIKILRSMPFGSATKGLVIKITDPVLLNKTGGIVQGM